MTILDYGSALSQLCNALPLHAEEGPVREVIPQYDLVSIVEEACHTPDASSAIVGMVRRLYEALGLLEPSELLKGNWTFVSFPASLVGRSILESLATDGQSFVEPGYWIQGQHRPRPMDAIEEQREILRRLETRRVESTRAVTANPIRTVHVAWGLIRLGGCYLLRAREDKRRLDSSGFVFPGGRLDLTDLPNDRQSPDSLRDLFKVDSPLAAESLPSTLARELEEELGLLRSDFKATHQRTLSPFTMLEGSRNNLSYSQYNIAIYSIKLSPRGELKALDRVGNEADEWAWFTPSELATGRRVDGRTAFIDALSAELRDQIEYHLANEIPDSSSNPPAYTSDSDSIELPVCPNQPLIRGMGGSRKPLSFSPDDREWALLMILAWHARGFSIELHEPAIHLLGGGWIKFTDAKLLAATRDLATRAENFTFPFVETEDAGHCRLSIAQSQIFLDPECFEYSWLLEDTDKSIMLSLKAIETPWGTLKGKNILIPLSPGFTQNLAAVEKAGEPLKGDFEREVRDHLKPARAMGLRGFVTTIKGTFEIRVPLREG